MATYERLDGAGVEGPVLYCTVLYCTVLYCTVLTYERLHGAGVEGPVDPMFPMVVALLMVARAHVASVRAWG